MTNFNVGDIVELKSGGPKMTIGGITTYNGFQHFEQGVGMDVIPLKNAQCIWFTPGAIVNSWQFNIEALKLSEEQI